MRWLAAFLTLLFPALAGAEEFAGKVVGVSDGDTITVLRDKRPVKIRLHGIDCPEKNQPFGMKAKQFTSKLVFGRVVTVKVVTKDRYGRLVGKVAGFRQLAPGAKALGIDLGEELVRVGLAWWYRKHAPNETRLATLEEEARKVKRGLWAERAAVPPWDWRRGRRTAAAPEPAPKLNCFQACMRKNAMRAVAPEVIKAGCERECSTGDAAPTTTRHPDSAAVGPADAITYSGNVRSKVFHGPSCRHYRCKNCTVVFETAAGARKAGYRPHSACVPAASCSAPPASPCAKDRACRTKHDCVIVRRYPSCCPPCYKSNVWAVNRRASRAWQRYISRRSCAKTRCARCPQPPIKVGCIKSLCLVK